MNEMSGIMKLLNAMNECNEYPLQQEDCSTAAFCIRIHQVYCRQLSYEA